MPARRSYRLFLALLLLAVVGGLGWWIGHGSVPHAQPVSTDEILKGIAEARATDVPPAPSQVSDTAAPRSASLPALSIPLRDSWTELKRRADQGEASAACRLAAEMEYCDHVRRELDAVSRTLKWSVPNPAVDVSQMPALRDKMRRERESAAAESESLLREGLHCEGTRPFRADERLHYWRLAARNGSLPALRHYVLGEAFRNDETLGNLAALQVYRDEVEALALHGVAAGDVTLTIGLASAYVSDRTEGRNLFYQAITPDAAKALPVFLQAKALLDNPSTGPRRQGHLFASTVRELEAQLDAATLSRARERAAAFARDAPAPAREHSHAGDAEAQGSAAARMRGECTPR